MRWVVIVLALLCNYPASADTTNLRLLSSWSPAYVGRPEMVGRYVEQLQQRSDGDIQIRTIGPGAIPPFEQFEPVVAGLVDLLFTHGAYHLGETGIGMALDAVAADPIRRRSSGLWRKIEQHYRGFGLQLLSLPTSASGYHLLLREPIGDNCDLSGRKIRGSPVYHGLIRSLGGAPVVLPAGEIYAALEKKVIDGAAWPAAGSLPFRWYEVTDYFLRPTFGATTHLILMNGDRFDGLATPLQNLLLSEGEQLERHSHTRFIGLAEQEATAFATHGLQATSPCGVALENLDRYWAEGVWSLVEAKDGHVARQLRNFVERQALTPSVTPP